MEADATNDFADSTDSPKRIVEDRVSNVVGAGWANDVGSNGFDDGPEGSGTETPFVSMYRKRDKLGKTKVQPKVTGLLRRRFLMRTIKTHRVKGTCWRDNLHSDHYPSYTGNLQHPAE